MKRLHIGDTIGILGGGQLGRMLAISAARFGLKCHIYSPEEVAPARDVTRYNTLAPYDDLDALANFAATCNVVTCETENIPLRSLSCVRTYVPFYPGIPALRISQDRVLEKRFLAELGLPVAPFCPVNHPADLADAIQRIGFPAILKTRRFGYDGKGQKHLRTGNDLDTAWEDIGMVPAILEAYVPFEREISVLTARDRAGKVVTFCIPENQHEDGILRHSRVPADIDASLGAAAKDMAISIANTLEYVGLIAVEMFVEKKGGIERLMINEIAPRVHNSGHWTLDACTVDQFELHIRAIAGWPLVHPARHSDVIMTNLIGDDILKATQLLEESRNRPSFYGKTDIRPGRKMGHLNHLILRKEQGHGTQSSDPA